MAEEIQQIKEKIMELEKRIAKLEKPHSPEVDSSNPQQKKMSLREFLLSKKPLTDVERALSMGYYLEKFEDATSFNADDLGRSFRIAKEKVPQNINDKVNMNIKKGHIMELKEKKNSRKAWCLTSTGELFVENRFK
ncbi:MAG: hypothetical protein WC848_01340 [Parcubacteria group bacterium]|jgi:hypothetical protein